MNELQHYGVLGMKWGIRRAEKSGREYKYESLAAKRAQKRSDRLEIEARLNPTKKRLQARSSYAKSRQKLLEARDSAAERMARRKLTKGEKAAFIIYSLLTGPIMAGSLVKNSALMNEISKGKTIVDAGMRTVMDTSLRQQQEAFQRNNQIFQQQVSMQTNLRAMGMM